MNKACFNDGDVSRYEFWAMVTFLSLVSSVGRHATDATFVRVFDTKMSGGKYFASKTTVWNYLMKVSSEMIVKKKLICLDDVLDKALDYVVRDTIMDKMQQREGRKIRD